MSITQNYQSSIDSKFITISVMNNKNTLEHAHQEIELIYIIKGKLLVKVNTKNIKMKSSDFLLINPNEFHSFLSENDNLFVVFHFNYFELSALLGQKNLIFSCNSVENTKVSDQEFRTVIEELLTVYLKQNGTSKIEFQGITLKLFSTLVLNYFKNKNPLEIKAPSNKGNNDRLSEIIGYIQTNYREPLTLDEVAGMHFISIPYMSTLFKKQTGKTFYQYLNEIRLAYAVNELISSKKPVTRIALDNGFPNLPSFNRVFNETYQMKPVEYRKQMSQKSEPNEEQSPETPNEEKLEVYSELRQYLTKTIANRNQTIPKVKTDIETQVINLERLDSFSKYWNKIINIGYATDILTSDMQEQISMMQNDIGFTYARFWGLFSDGMQIEDRSGDKITYNFSKANKLMDFLLKNKLKPFIELGPKHKLITKTTDETLIVHKVSERSLEEWVKISKAFLLNCVKRYGIEEVETWYFEIWRKHSIPVEPNYHVSEFVENIRRNQDPSQFEEYFKIFSAFKRTANEIIPLVKVGGCGLSMDLEGEKLDLFLQQWELEEIQPDFLSVYLFPNDFHKKIPIKNMHSANPSYIKNKLYQVRKAMKKAGFDDLELNVTEWNVSISNRNFLNDSSFKASYMVRSIIENLNENRVNMIGYWLCSDIFSDFRDSKYLLHGGAGLLTKSGIKKPSYYAFSLLKQLGERLVAKGENYIVTKKSGDQYQVLCFNYKHFNYSYHLHPEGSTALSEQYEIFENTEPLNLSLKIQGVTNGKYRVKELRVNRDHGSVLDEWLKLDEVADLKQDEVEHLKQICVPYLKVGYTFVDQNSIVLKEELQPHEIRIIILNMEYDE